MAAARTFSPLLPDDVLTLAVQELQVVGHHPLLALVEDFGIGAGVEVLPTPHLLVFQPSQDLQGAMRGVRDRGGGAGEWCGESKEDREVEVSEVHGNGVIWGKIH